MPPVVFWVLGAIGAVAVAKWIAHESRRINAELHPEPSEAVVDANERERRSTLRRDSSGVYRPQG